MNPTPYETEPYLVRRSHCSDAKITRLAAGSEWNIHGEAMSVLHR